MDKKVGMTVNKTRVVVMVTNTRRYPSVPMDFTEGGGSSMSKYPRFRKQQEVLLSSPAAYKKSESQPQSVQSVLEVNAIFF